MKKFISILAALLIATMLLGSASAAVFTEFGGSKLTAAYVEATAMVNLRSGPGLGYKDIGTVYEGTTLTYLDQFSIDERGVAWYRVHYKNSSAWISSKYSELYGANAVTWLYATDGKSYLRKSPNLNGQIITTFQKGDSAEYLGSSSIDERGVTWYRVCYEGNTGWVSSRYTSFQQYNRTVYASDGDSKIRNAPNLNGDILGFLYEGESAIYMETSSIDNRGVAWYQVKIDGVIGWISSRYTEIR